MTTIRRITGGAREPTLVFLDAGGRVIYKMRLDLLLRVEQMNGAEFEYVRGPLSFEILETDPAGAKVVQFSASYRAEDFPHRSDG